MTWGKTILFQPERSAYLAKPAIGQTDKSAAKWVYKRHVMYIV